MFVLLGSRFAIAASRRRSGMAQSLPAARLWRLDGGDKGLDWSDEIAAEGRRMDGHAANA